jgi:hypothetical protein
MRWVADLGDDVRYALRTSRNSRTSAFAIVRTLGLGIGVRVLDDHVPVHAGCPIA